MNRIKVAFRRFAVALMLLFSVALTGCSGLTRVQEADTASTATPLPESQSDDGLTVQKPDACLVARDAVIQLGKPQGNLLAWQPGEDKLAFVAPVGRSWGWSVGDVVLASPGEGEPVATSDVHAAGDLTWSPEGTWLAFVALRTLDSQYTVMVWRPADNNWIDLFAQGAATDTFAGRKGIIRWVSNNTLQLSMSCGVDCSREVEVGVISGEQAILRETRLAEDTSLDVDLNQPEGFVLNPEWFNPNVSPDEMSVFFSDENDVAWVGESEEGIKFPLDLQNGTALESKWSDDGRYLAVRTDQQVLVFKMDCTESGEVRKLSQPGS